MIGQKVPKKPVDVFFFLGGGCIFSGGPMKFESCYVHRPKKTTNDLICGRFESQTWKIDGWHSFIHPTARVIPVTQNKSISVWVIDICIALPETNSSAPWK